VEVIGPFGRARRFRFYVSVRANLGTIAPQAIQSEPYHRPRIKKAHRHAPAAKPALKAAEPKSSPAQKKPKGVYDI
jgi:hypothetical protein